MSHVEIYTDGGREPNPGPGGYGVVLLHPKRRAEASGGFRLTTNNQHSTSTSTSASVFTPTRPTTATALC